ncbi:cilia- and flagella-associated protein 99 isoform X2 [Narcine bancroftii]|uniref:cilia- and flagella-associated protein 99 isoform X2 n=1 Tax=Narcine bancroftii TaxID=1343680 RepID=UPI0038320427
MTTPSHTAPQHTRRTQPEMTEVPAPPTVIDMNASQSPFNKSLTLPRFSNEHRNTNRNPRECFRLKMPSHSQLLADIVRLLDQFDPQRNSPDHFVSDAAKIYKAQDEAEQVFLVEVLSGCLYYRPLLDVIVNGFYVQDGNNFLRLDCNLFAVICYLATFRLNELGLKHFTKFISSQDVNKMHKFLKFFFDVENLSTWIKDEWCQIYDVAYVKEKLIDSLLRWQPDIQNVIDHLANVLANKVIHKKEKQPVTVPNEFNLTKPKPRAIPMPEEILQLQVQRKIPRSTYEPPREKMQLQQLKEKNRQRAEEHLIEANVDQFRCAIPQESDKRRILSGIMKEKEAKKIQILPKARQVPRQITENIPIKLNTAAILRENALYQRKVKEELQRIDHIIEGGHDPVKFEEYQKQKNEELKEQWLADAERRHLEEKIFFEELILAREARIEEKRQRAAQQKGQAEELRQRYREMRLQEEKELKAQVEQVLKGHKDTKEQQRKIQECKQKMAKEMNQEMKEILQQVMEKTNAEIRKKAQQIREIRASQAAPAIKKHFLDLSKPAGHNLLDEMSLLELRERLGLLKEAQMKEEEDKRDRILNEKQTKERLLLDKLEQISLNREAMSKKAVLRQREEELKKVKLSKLLSNNQQLVDLQRKLESNKKEHQELIKMQKKKSQENLQRVLGSRTAERKATEEHWWQNLESSREHKAQLLKLGGKASQRGS